MSRYVNIIYIENDQNMFTGFDFIYKIENWFTLCSQHKNNFSTPLDLYTFGNYRV